MAPDTVLESIRSALADLPAAQRRLAEIVLENPAQVAFLSSHDLAARTGASPSTVVRLARSLGYSGFPAFQAALRGLLTRHLSPTTRLYSTLATRTSQEFLESCLQADLRALEEAAQTVSHATFAAVAELLAQAPRIYLVGLGIAVAVVEALAFRLRRLRLHVQEATRGGSDLLEVLLPLGKGDVLIAVAFHRVRPEILAAMDLAYARGGTLVAFAESPLSPHALKADYVLQTQRGPANTLNSLVVPMAVANALCLAVARRREEEAALAYRWVAEYQEAQETAGRPRFTVSDREGGDA